MTPLAATAWALIARFLRREDDPLAEFSDDEVESAALRVLKERPECRESWFGGTVAKCDETLAKIDELRGKYANIEPLRMRRAVIGWLDYFEHKARAARRDCETGKSRRDLDAHVAREAAKSVRVRAVLDRLRK